MTARAIPINPEVLEILLCSFSFLSIIISILIIAYEFNKNRPIKSLCGIMALASSTLLAALNFMNSDSSLIVTLVVLVATNLSLFSYGALSYFPKFVNYEKSKVDIFVIFFSLTLSVYILLVELSFFATSPINWNG